MSKRYGRNQKRKAREQIAKLERARDFLVDLHKKDTSDLLRELGDARRQLDNVRQALGPNFIGLSPEMVVGKVYEIGENYDFRLPVPDGDVTMRSMVYRSFNDSERHVHRLHFRVELAGRQVGYVISDPALRRTPAEFLAREIGLEMAHLLVRDLRKAGVRG